VADAEEMPPGPTSLMASTPISASSTWIGFRNSRMFCSSSASRISFSNEA
jgi:hypothetical protein